MFPLPDGSDYVALFATHTFASPMASPATFSRLVTILNDSVVEPCEDFIVTLTSSSERTVFNGGSSRSVIIRDDEGRDKQWVWFPFNVNSSMGDSLQMWTHSCSSMTLHKSPELIWHSTITCLVVLKCCVKLRAELNRKIVSYCTSTRGTTSRCVLATFTGSPPVGSLAGSWLRSSVTKRVTLQRLAIAIQSYCPSTGQTVPTFEDRPFRTGIFSL